MWTYSGDPATSDKDRVRFLIGDTNISDQQLQDEEIAWLIAEHTTYKVAAIEALETLAAKYARLTDKAVGDLRISYSQRQGQYLTLAQRLRSRFDIPAPYAGGIRISDKETDTEDSDLVQPTFTTDLHEHREPISELREDD